MKICIVCKQPIPPNRSFYEDAKGQRVHDNGECIEKTVRK